MINAFDQSVALQFPKLLGEHLLRNARQIPFHLQGADQWISVEPEQDRKLPASLKHAHHPRHVRS